MNLRDVRGEYNLSQAAAAKRVGLSQAQWSKIETGGAELPPLVAWALGDPELRRRLLEDDELRDRGQDGKSQGGNDGE